MNLNSKYELSNIRIDYDILNMIPVHSRSGKVSIKLLSFHFTIFKIFTDVG